MFPFFKKRAPLAPQIKEEPARCVAGLAVLTDRQHYRRDVAALQKRFQSARDGALELSYPRATIVQTSLPQGDGRFRYFVGDLVDSPQQPESLELLTLPAGLYASVTVDFKTEEQLGVEIAKTKRDFFERWLPASGYRASATVESIERYDRRSTIKLASMELSFPLEKAEEKPEL